MGCCVAAPAAATVAAVASAVAAAAAQPCIRQPTVQAAPPKPSPKFRKKDLLRIKQQGPSLQDLKVGAYMRTVRVVDVLHAAAAARLARSSGLSPLPTLAAHARCCCCCCCCGTATSEPVLQVNAAHHCLACRRHIMKCLGWMGRARR